MLTLPIVLAGVFGLSGVALAGLGALYKRPWTARFRIREEPARRLGGWKFWNLVVRNCAMSAAVIVGSTTLLQPWFFRPEPASAWEVAFAAVKILLLYDFLYYLLHRYAFHQWKLLKPVHALHHTARFPRALDSMYVHPIEMFLGVVLLLSCTLVVGPVPLGAFAVAFLVWSLLNIVVHCGLDIRVFPLSWFGTLARKHDTHHVSMRGGNFASITPIFDWLFGTAE